MLMLNAVEGELERIKAAMAEDAKGDEAIQKLEKVPGVGLMTAYAFVAHVDVKRFENANQVSNYLGLVPKVDMSGTIVRYGRITKRGNGYVRSLLNQASWALVRSKDGGALKERYEYMTKEQGKSKKKSIVAVSRRLADMMYTILKTGRSYEARKFTPGKNFWVRSENLTEKLAAQADAEVA
jgi:transposase